MRKLAICLALVALCAVSVKADTLNTADSFAVLAGSQVTNTDTTQINGSVGVWPGSAISGFPPGVVTAGVIYYGGAVPQQAQSDLTNAFTTLAGLGAAGTTVTGGVLNTFNGGCGLGCYSPGDYNDATSLTGTMKLNDGGVAGSVFIFYTGPATTLITSTDSKIDVSGLSPSDSLFWVVGSSATLGVRSVFYGNILALTSITFDPGATDLCGRALARNGEVSFDGMDPESHIQNQVSIGCVDTPGAGGGGFNGGAGPVPGPVPEPSTVLLLASGLIGVAARMRRARARE